MRTLILLFLVISPIGLFSQSFAADCSTAAAQTLTVDGTCTSNLSVNNAAGSPAYTGCATGGAEDGWLYFVATSNSTAVSYTSANNRDVAIMVYQGASCASLSLLSCTDRYFEANGTVDAAEITTVSGSPYYIRIVDLSTGTPSGSICVTNTPSNNSCATATTLTSGTACSPINGTTLNATESSPVAACSGNNNDDVWYKFIATGTSENILVNPVTGINSVIEIFTGTCASLTSAICQNTEAAGVPEAAIVNGFTIGNTYYFRVFESGTGSGGAFNVCVNTPITPAGNNECSGAISITSNTIINASNFTFDSQCTQTLCSDANTLDCYIGPPSPPSACSLLDYASCMSIETNAWYTFTPPTTGNYYFNLYNQQCVVGDGMQMWLGTASSSCPTANNFTEVFCQSNATPETITLNANLTAGVNYYLIADGFAGDECNYSMLISPTINLPVNLSHIKATRIDQNSAKINWTTLQYKDLKKFEVEKSTDAMYFTTIGEVNTSTYESSEIENFEFIDKNCSSNDKYYRVKMIDQNGTFDYTSIVELNKLNNLADIILKPNPTDNNTYLEIKSAKDEEMLITVYSIESKKVLEFTAIIQEGINSIPISSDELHSGVYLVKVSSKSLTKTIKLFKN